MKKYLLFLSLGLLVACSKPTTESTTTTTPPTSGEITTPPAETTEDPNMEQAPAEPAADMKGWKTYKQANYSIQYPADWKQNEDPNSQAEFAFLSPQESVKDQFMENVNMVTEDLTGKGNVTLADYAAASEGQIVANIEKATILQSNPVKSKTGVHHKMIYTGEQMGFPLQFEQHYYVLGNTAYVLTFTTEQGRFDEFKTIGETILNSFVIQ